MSKCGMLALTLMMTLCLGGCAKGGHFSDADMDIYERIHAYYAKMQSYSAEVRLTVKGSRTENVYVIEQLSKGDRTLARVKEPERIEGAEVVQNGETAGISLGGDRPFALSTAATDEPDCCFVNNFLSLYYGSEETAVSVSAGEEGGSTLLETELPGVSARRSRASMLVDNRTLAPKNISVYDSGGNIALMAEFTQFNYNALIQDEIFEIVS